MNYEEGAIVSCSFCGVEITPGDVLDGSVVTDEIGELTCVGCVDVYFDGSEDFEYDE